ncbi:unnamed protein product [Brassica oleracea]
MDGTAEKTNRLRRDISIVLGLLMMEDKATASTEVFDDVSGFHLRRVSIGDFGVPPSSSFVIAPSELQANPSSSPNHSRFTAVVVEPRKSH